MDFIFVQSATLWLNYQWFSPFRLYRSQSYSKPLTPSYEPGHINMFTKIQFIMISNSYRYQYVRLISLVYDPDRHLSIWMCEKIRFTQICMTLQSSNINRSLSFIIIRDKFYNSGSFESDCPLNMSQGKLTSLTVYFVYNVIKMWALSLIGWSLNAMKLIYVVNNSSL